MKKIIGVLIICLLMAGCSLASEEVMIKSAGTRTDVFSEIDPGETVQQGIVELQIKASIKTHLKDYYVLESSKSLPGKAGYPFVVNIDDQAATWTVAGVKDSRPEYGKDGKTSHDPEAGDGIKYTLDKTVRLAAGRHNIFFGLPEENYYKKLEITLEVGKKHILEFKPQYMTKTLPHRIPTFLKGILEYDVFLDDSLVPGL